MLLCDLAEYYKIYDYKAFSPNYIAILTLGLKENSRVKMKLKGLNITSIELLLAGIHDIVRLILYSKTEDAQKRKNFPKLILQELQKVENDVQAFSSSEEFENALNKILKGGE